MYSKHYIVKKLEDWQHLTKYESGLQWNNFDNSKKKKKI